MRLLLFICGLGLLSCNAQTVDPDSIQHNEDSLKTGENMEQKVNKTEEQWREVLSDEQFLVLREKGTEKPFTGKYNMHFEDGVYYCSACEAPLFKSDSKFESHCGWPSFDKPISRDAVIEKLDTTVGMNRTEIICGKCDGHLGHVFNDGPTETGLRYCINSVSLEFDNKEEK